jgi:hypothetical protein
MKRGWRTAAPWCVAWAGALAGCRAVPTTEECAAAADHYIDLALAEMPAHASFSPSQAAAVRDVERGVKRAEPAFRAVEDRCTRLRRAEVACARDAPTTRAWEACIQTGDGGR